MTYIPIICFKSRLKIIKKKPVQTVDAIQFGICKSLCIISVLNKISYNQIMAGELNGIVLINSYLLSSD